jgi:hypothetical protein
MGERVQEMLAQAEVKPDLKPASQTHRRGDANLASFAMAAAAIGMDPETRFLEERRDEVTSWGVTATGSSRDGRQGTGGQPATRLPTFANRTLHPRHPICLHRALVVRQQIGRGPTEPAQGCVQAGQPRA